MEETRHWFLMVLLLAFACDEASMNGTLRLQTMLQPAQDFSEVRVTRMRDGETVLRQRDANFNDDFVSGDEVASFSDRFLPGDVLRVELLLFGEVQAKRDVILRAGSDDILVLVGGECSSACTTGFDCVGDRCLPMDCLTGNEDSCPSAECERDQECESQVACAIPSCFARQCITRADDSKCSPESFCFADRGCVPVAEECGDGIVDSKIGEACETDAIPSCTQSKKQCVVCAPNCTRHELVLKNEEEAPCSIQRKNDLGKTVFEEIRTFDSRGNLVRQEHESDEPFVYEFAYDNSDRLVHARHTPSRKSEAFEYDDDGRLVNYHHYDGVSLSIHDQREYDAAGRLIRITYRGAEVYQKRFFYRVLDDKIDRIERDDKIDGTVDSKTVYQYEVNGLLSQISTDDGLDGIPDEVTRITYDGRNRVISESYIGPESRHEKQISYLTNHIIEETESWDDDRDGQWDRRTQSAKSAEQVISESIDHNGDGQWDWRQEHEWHDTQLRKTRIDVDGDGVWDNASTYEYGVFDTLREKHVIEVESTKTLRLERWNYDRKLNLIRHEIDENGDGIFEDVIARQYDEFGSPIVVQKQSDADEANNYLETRSYECIYRLISP